MGKERPKKVKLTKAEKEKLKKEEAQRKAAEEEVARLKAEEEAKENEERERQEKEERRLFEETERVRHQAEIDELNSHLRRNKECLRKLHLERSMEKKWQRYMACDGKPDIFDKKDINTFLSLLFQTKDPLATVIEKCEALLSLVDAINDEVEEMHIDEYEETIDEFALCKSRLLNLVMEKLNESIHKSLVTPGNAINTETKNISQVVKSKNIAVYVWGNSARNPRVKQINFANEVFTMELPKQMAMSNIALRVVYTQFDIFSSKCSSYVAKTKPIKTFADEQPEAEASQVDSEVNEDRKSVLSTKSLALSNKQSNRTAVSSLSVKNDGCQVEEQTSEVFEEEKEVEEGLDCDCVDLRSNAPMGPIILIELLELPPQAKEVNGWIMQQKVSGGLRKIDYGKHNDDIDLKTSTTSVVNKESSVIDYHLPLAVCLRVSNDCIMHDSPQIARWDEECNHWKTDVIMDLQHAKDDQLLYFRTAKLGPFAVMQNIYLNMPYEEWSLRPTGLNECVLKIVGACIVTEVYVKSGLCSVLFKDRIKLLPNLVDKWMTPKKLIECLRAAGVNIFPYEDGHKYVSVSHKLESLLVSLHQHMALTATCITYQWSKWNSDIGEEKVVVQAKEWLTAEVPTGDYNLYMASTRICCKLQNNDNMEKFSEGVHPNSQLHPDLYHMLSDEASQEARQRLNNSSVVFIDCVYRLLSAANVFVYA